MSSQRNFDRSANMPGGCVKDSKCKRHEEDKEKEKEKECNKKEKDCSSCCYSYDELCRVVRKLEAIQITTQLNSTVTDALDKVLDATPGSAEFNVNVEYVLGLQCDPEHMNIYIGEFGQIRNAAEFRAAWLAGTTNIQYRKRFIANYIVTDYSDDGCCRKIGLQGIGVNFIQRTPTAVPPNFPGGQPQAIVLDRFHICWLEDSECPGSFCVKSLVQQTETIWPLTVPPFVVSDPFNSIGAINSSALC